MPNIKIKNLYPSPRRFFIWKVGIRIHFKVDLKKRIARVSQDGIDLWEFSEIPRVIVPVSGLQSGGGGFECTLE